MGIPAKRRREVGNAGADVSSAAAYMFGDHLVTCLATAKHFRLRWISGQALELGVSLVVVVHVCISDLGLELLSRGVDTA